MKIGNQLVESKPFLWTTLIWSIVGLLAVLGFTEEPKTAAVWYCGMLTLSLMNLFLLVKFLAVVLVLVSDQVSEKRSMYLIQAAFFGFCKLVVLGTMIALIFKANHAPALPILLGMGAMVVIPLGGGFWWSQKGLSHA